MFTTGTVSKLTPTGRSDPERITYQHLYTKKIQGRKRKTIYSNSTTSSSPRESVKTISVRWTFVVKLISWRHQTAKYQVNYNPISWKLVKTTKFYYINTSPICDLYPTKKTFQVTFCVCSETAQIDRNICSDFLPTFDLYISSTNR